MCVSAWSIFVSLIINMLCGKCSSIGLSIDSTSKNARIKHIQSLGLVIHRHSHRNFLKLEQSVRCNGYIETPSSLQTLNNKAHASCRRINTSCFIGTVVIPDQYVSMAFQLCAQWPRLYSISIYSLSFGHIRQLMYGICAFNSNSVFFFI